MLIGNIVAAILLAIGVFLLSTILHELAHMLMCKILGCKVIGWKILFIWHDGQRVSLDLTKKNHCAFVTNSIKKMRTIVAAGPVSDIILTSMCLIFALKVDQAWCKYGLFGAACLIMCSIVYNLLPKTNGDGKMLFGKGGV